MFFKCNYCDPSVKRGEKSIKSIDSKKDDFLQDQRGKYYHTNCYREYLSLKKKKKDDEIEVIIQSIKDSQLEKSQIQQNKRDFYKWIKSYYDTDLPAYFCIKISSIVSGKHEQIHSPVGYDILLDIYKHMERYLSKNATKKSFNSISSRMNYDLTVIISNLGDYKRFKNKQNEDMKFSKKIEEDIKKDRINRERIKRVQQKEEKDTFNIMDIMDDLLI
ncbi:hypothetical protein [Brevibacillus laterosporus]|uniref:hypothetical protein n=1 Tax=Brevibacillus laterosporus TaxID=1465 RepID=UPI001EF1B183|nr:hypothetical protein [Brevibacillus laterosporus]MCG7317629.1 hypothetical protein [Brevibacillus laterosporus]